MSRNTIIPYNPRLKKLARKLRLNSTKAEVILWKNIKNKVFGPQFHRQVPIDDFIVDFYCHELKLVIEVDGSTHDYNFEHDDLRQKKLESFGIKVIRFSDEDVKIFLTEVLRTVKWVIDDLTTSPNPLQRGRVKKNPCPVLT